MGRQVNFYLLPLDEQALLAQMWDIKPFDIYRPSPKRPKEMITLDDLNAGRVTINDQWGIALSPQSPPPMLSYRKYSSGDLGLNYSSSEVLQFSRCGCEFELVGKVRRYSNYVRTGRFWYTTHTEAGVAKSTVFVKWAESILRWCSRNYVMLDDRRTYIAPEAERLWSMKEIRLAGVDPR